jgi:hypothetical protein
MAPSTSSTAAWLGSRPRRIVSVLLANLDAVAGELDRGAFVVIAEERIRIRGLPLR